MTPVALVTGFGPFLDVVDNPSGRVATGLDGRRVGAVAVRGLVLPVSYADAPAVLAAALETLRPACVIGLGVGHGEHIALEVGARNHADSAHPDGAGQTLRGHRLVPGGIERLSCELPLVAWARELSRPGAPVTVSADAGAYVCNATYYTLLNAEYTLRNKLFVHLPRRTDKDAIDAAVEVVVALVRRLTAVRA